MRRVGGFESWSGAAAVRLPCGVLRCFAGPRPALFCVALRCLALLWPGLKLAEQGWAGLGITWSASHRALQPSRGAVSRESCLVTACSGYQAQD